MEKERLSIELAESIISKARLLQAETAVMVRDMRIANLKKANKLAKKIRKAVGAQRILLDDLNEIIKDPFKIRVYLGTANVGTPPPATSTSSRDVEMAIMLEAARELSQNKAADQTVRFSKVLDTDNIFKKVE